MFSLFKVLVPASAWEVGIVHIVVARSPWGILHDGWRLKLTWVVGQRASEQSGLSLRLCGSRYNWTSLGSEKLLESMAKLVLVMSHCSFQIIFKTTISFLFPQGSETICSSLRYGIFALNFLPESRAACFRRVCTAKFENLDALSDIEPSSCWVEVDSEAVDFLIDIFKVAIIAQQFTLFH